jgi:hypothetical protein
LDGILCPRRTPFFEIGKWSEWQGCQMLSIVSYQKSQFGQILEGLLTKNIGILVHTFYGHLECALYAHLLHIMASLLVIVWSSDAFPPILVYITKKNLATLMRDEKKLRNANFTPDC